MGSDRDIVLHPVLKPLLEHDIPYSNNQDTLGLLYMALTCLSKRKANGIYYTPFKVVDAMVHELQQHCDIAAKNIIDPCSGTGNFLLTLFNSLQKSHPKLSPDIILSQLYGTDIDPISVALTRINMLLVSKTANCDLLYHNFVCENSLLRTDNTYDIVIGNPPWGYAFQEGEKAVLRTRYESADTVIESFNLFFERALALVREGGIIFFVLPESILNVKIHQKIRDILLKKSRFLFIRYWGNIFDGVFTPAISLLLTVRTNSFTTQNLVICSSSDEYFTITTTRDTDRHNFNFMSNDQQYSLLHKLLQRDDIDTLATHADFALGIVTGDNKDHLLATQVTGSEIIVRGSNIFKYRYVPSHDYLLFDQSQYQQVAPIALYRTPEKLFYRFICDTLVFAYDNKGTLSLNSANIVIPKLPYIPIKYVLAVLNSSVAQYIFTYKYRSVKVLRSHIESLPIPKADIVMMATIVTLVDMLLMCNNARVAIDIHNQIDELIMDLFHVSKEERLLLRSNIPKAHMFFK